jgi:hypothetical protein
MARNKKSFTVVNVAKTRLESVARTMSKSTGKKFEFAFDSQATTPDVALGALQTANDYLHTLRFEMANTEIPASRREKLASDVATDLHHT